MAHIYQIDVDVIIACALYLNLSHTPHFNAAHLHSFSVRATIIDLCIVTNGEFLFVAQIS